MAQAAQDAAQEVQRAREALRDDVAALPSRVPNRSSSARLTPAPMPSCSTSSRRSFNPGTSWLNFPLLPVPYAEALFGAALTTTRPVWRCGPTWSARWRRSPPIPTCARRWPIRVWTTSSAAKVFTGLIKSQLPQAARNFIELLVKNDRLLLLPVIATQFVALKNRHEGTAQAEITSAFELSDAQVKSWIAALELKFGLKAPAARVGRSGTDRRCAHWLSGTRCSILP